MAKVTLPRRTRLILITALAAIASSAAIAFVIVVNRRPAATRGPVTDVPPATIAATGPVTRTTAAATPVPSPASKPAQPPAVAGTATLARATDLHASGHHAEALRCLDDYVKQNPVDRTVLWETEALGNKITLVGATRAYLIAGFGTYVPAVVKSDKRPPAFTGGSAEIALVTCVDLADGNVLWRRQFQGKPEYFIDPVNDDLYASDRVLVRARAADGGKVQSLTKPDKPFFGLTRDGRHSPRAEHLNGSFRNERVPLFDVVTAQRVEVDYREALGNPAGLRLEPNAHAQLVARGPAFEPLWQLDLPRGLGVPPRVIGVDVFVVSGTATRSTEVLRVDARSGQPVWRTRLPVPPRPMALDPNRPWRGVAETFGAYRSMVVVLDADETAWLLDTPTGRTLGRYAAGEVLCSVPRLIGDDRLLVTTERGVRCVSVPAITGARADSGDRAVALLRARCQAALGRPADGLATLLAACEHDPDFRDGLTLAADLAERAGRRGAAVTAHVRLLTAGDATHADWLQRETGLVRWLPGEGVLADPVLVAGRIYFGDMAGVVHVIDPASLAEVDTIKLDRTPMTVTAEKNLLRAACDDLSSVTVVEFDRTVSIVSPDAKPPAARPAGADFSSTVPNAVVADPATGLVARVAWTQRQSTFDLRAPGGQTPARSEPIRSTNFNLAGRIVPLGGGFLLCGRDLVRLTPGVKPPWRFAGAEDADPPPPEPPGPPSDIARIPMFTRPLIHDGRLFVGARKGGLYCFDLSRI